MRCALIGLAAVLVVAARALPAAETDLVRIGVLGLFHSSVMEVSPVAGAVTVSGCGESVRLEGGRGATLRAAPDGVGIAAGATAFVCDSVATDARSELELRIPGKIRRRYRGRVEVGVSGGALEIVVAMRREEALAAIVAGETDSDWPPAALEAQAVVSRSYLEAGGRHAGFDFCDSTHCQYLADSPAADGDVLRALQATGQAVLVHDGKPLEALFTRSCSGRTLTSRAAGMAESDYRYEAVECPACSRRATTWSRRFPGSLARELEAVGTEAARIGFVRRHGWRALPSVSFETRVEGDEVAVEGVGEGHGVGLCQRGALELARRGADWTAILRHFFPNASIR